ncbi:MAG: sugar phosphate isomerase/epimerase family protein [Anaerolineae bacterium]|jgi:sugar phosphate isomerase/epimerase
MNQELPLLGVAAPVARLPEYVDWLLRDQRPLELQDPFDALDRFDGDLRDLVAQARSYLDGYTGSLGLHGPFVSLSLDAGDPRIRQVVSDRLVRALEFGAELGARHMVLHSPFGIFGLPMVEHTGAAHLRHMIETVHTTLERPLALALEIGCKLVIETIADVNPMPLCALVSSFERGVGLSIDVGHNLITEQFGGPPPHGWVEAAGDLLAHVHLQDGDGVIDRHWQPGQGRMNWPALFAALRGAPADTVLIIEVRDGLQAAAWLAERGLAR